MLTLHVEAAHGDTIAEACRDALALSCRLAVWVVFDFNDRQISVQPHNTVEQLVAAFRATAGAVLCYAASETPP